MNWTANNIYQYRDCKLQASNGNHFKWYTDGSGVLVLRLDDKFRLIVLETRNINDLLSFLNMMQMKPVS